MRISFTLENVMCYRFLSPADVIQGFEELGDEIRSICNDEVDELPDYFENNFIGHFREKCTLPSSIVCVGFMEHFQQNR